MKKRKKEEGKREKTTDKKIDGGKETNIESGARRKIFGVWLHYMGLARVDYLMHPADG